MKFKQLLCSLFLAVLSGALAFSPALAFPPLPSSFYGQVKNNGQNVPEGTLVRALIGGKAYATSRILLYQGSSVFRIDVAGDETDTPAIEGGKEGDAIQFEVGGVIAKESGVWHSGTNVNLDLTLTSSGPLQTPPPAPAAAPSQTAISVAVGRAPTAASGPAAADSSSAGVVVGVVAVIVVLGGGTWFLLRKKK